MTTMVSKVDILTTATDVSAVGPYRQIQIAGSAPKCTFQVYSAEASSGAARLIGTAITNAAGDAAINFPNGIDCSLFYKYAVTGTPGSNLKIWVQGNLFPAS